jgi:type VI protein secretion system component Hcp
MRRGGFKGLVAAGLVATGIAASTSVVAASDMFLKLGTIQGGSVDKSQKGAMELLAWAWGTSTGDANGRKGRVPSACIQDLELKKLIDTASPALIMMGVNGDVVPKGTLTVRSSDDIQENILTLELTNVSVQSYQIDAEQTLVESVVLHFESLKGVYTPLFFGKPGGQSVEFEVSGACP